MSTFRERLDDEIQAEKTYLEGVTERSKKLDGFICSDGFSNIDVEQQRLLKTQLVVMTAVQATAEAFQAVLNARIEQMDEIPLQSNVRG